VTPLDGFAKESRLVELRRIALESRTRWIMGMKLHKSLELLCVVEAAQTKSKLNVEPTLRSQAGIVTIMKTLKSLDFGSLVRAAVLDGLAAAAIHVCDSLIV
jgi:hypothetical protein